MVVAILRVSRGVVENVRLPMAAGSRCTGQKTAVCSTCRWEFLP